MHTFLSILGVIIGVAALVAILSLGDGLEKFARDQISATTSLRSIIINPKTSMVTDGIRIPIENHPNLTMNDAVALQQKFEKQAFVTINKQRSIQIGTADDSLRFPALLAGTTDLTLTGLKNDIRAGRFFNESDLGNAAQIIILNNNFAGKLAVRTEALIGKELNLENNVFEIVGVMEEKDTDQITRGYVPFTSFFERGNDTRPAMVEIRSNRVENVSTLKKEAESWLDENIKSGREGFTVVTNNFRVEQAKRGVLAFKIVMGMITGIAVVVGGIGIMNVLLISVSERTKEIGIRKATGAKKGDILFQFLAESITVSFIGSFLGLLLGLLLVFSLFPIVQSFADVPFQPAFSFDTLIIITVIAILIGIIFGTFPAWKAAKLQPIDAIRRE
jgi:putative ABC transport system permease protein